MPAWEEKFKVPRGQVTLHRRSTSTYQYRLDGQQTFPASTTATMKFYNTYGQEIQSWVGTVSGGVIDFTAVPTLANVIPADSSFEIVANYGGTVPRLMLWGNTVRDEARYPNEPINTAVDPRQYSYSFLAPGPIRDPSWRILNGNPTIWDNSFVGQPNAAACGIFFDDGAMMWYAPVATDSVKINYTLRTSGNGKCTMGLCSNYDGTNWLGITHYDNGGSDQLLVEVGTGPVTMSTQQTTSHPLVNLSNYTAEYNFLTNTLAIWKGTDLTPITTWVDTTNLIQHGEGERYFMFNWRAALLATGPQLVSFKILDS